MTAIQNTPGNLLLFEWQIGGRYEIPHMTRQHFVYFVNMTNIDFFQAADCQSAKWEFVRATVLAINT